MRACDVSPLWTIENDTLIGFDLAFTQGLHLRGLDSIAKTDEALNSISAQICRLLSNIPDDHVLRFYATEISTYESILGSYKNRFGKPGIGQKIAWAKARQCADTISPRRRELMCFVSTPTERQQHSFDARLLGRSIHKLARRAQELHSRKLVEVDRVRCLVEAGLTSIGVAAHRLTKEDLFGAMWRMANPVTSLRLEAPKFRSDFSLRSQLFHQGFVQELDWFRREDGYHRVLTLRLPPRFVQPLSILEMQCLPFPYQLAVTLRRVGDDEAQDRISATRLQGHEWNRVLARLRGAQRNQELPDHAVLQQRVDTDDVLSRLTNGERLYDVAMQLWFCAESAEELQYRTDTAISQIRAFGQAEAGIETLQTARAFVSMLPGHHGIIGDRYHPMLASRAADCLPVFQSWHGSEHPYAILTTRRQELVGFDPFHKELMAWNATIAGGTGSGKSFTARTLLTGWVAAGGRLIVVTRGTDYHRYAEVFGGQIRDVKLDDPDLCLNPFPPRGAIAGTSKARTILEHLSSIVGLMVAESGISLTKVSRRLIYSAIMSLYGLDDAGENAGTKHEDEPNFKSWMKELQGIALQQPEITSIAQDMIQQLRFWIDGPYGNAFTRSFEGAAANRLTVWNLADIQGAETQEIVLALISGHIAQMIQSGPTIVVMDEVWSLLARPAGAALVETLYRTVRKEGSSIWTISQSMNDYVNLPGSTRSAILNNSPIKIFLAHDPSELNLVTETFHLNERETALLSSLRSIPGQYSEMLMMFGGVRQVLQVRPTGLEYWLGTSHPKDVAVEIHIRSLHPQESRFRILQRLAKQFPKGALDHEIKAA